MEKESVFGMYRAVVVDNKDTEQFGRILVHIPKLMPAVDRTKGIWARPANNPLGGRNQEDNSDNYYMGTSYIPRKGSWVFIFFEGGNINKPYYFGALDLENTKVLPENQVGSNYEHKWTLFKSHEGRTVVVSDDPDDARVEITGKKRKLKTPPTGDRDSVYLIDSNQTTILLDEREGKQKLLIRTYKGDYINIDIDEQQLQCYFKSGIKIQTDGDLNITVAGDTRIETGGDMYNQSSGDIYIKSNGEIKEQADQDIHIKSGGIIYTQAALNYNIKAGGYIATDGAARYNQDGSSSPALDSQNADPSLPEGKRDT